VRELFKNYIGYRLPDDISNMISEFEDAIQLICWGCFGVIHGNVYRRFEGQITGREYYFCCKDHWDNFKTDSLCCKCEREFKLSGFEYDDESIYYMCESRHFYRFKRGQLLCEDCTEGGVRCLCFDCGKKFKCDSSIG